MKKSERILYALSAVILILIGIALSKQFGSSEESNKNSSPSFRPVTTSVQDQFISKYAGGYSLEVDGFHGTDVESYVLRKDGTAVWLLIVPDITHSARTESKKQGTWRASEGRIVISIKGNAGTITEEFI